MPFAVGGSNDILARLIGEGLSKRLGQPFVALNRPGANTNTGTLQAVKAAPWTTSRGPISGVPGGAVSQCDRKKVWAKPTKTVAAMASPMLE